MPGIYFHRLALTSISTSISTSTDFCWLPSTPIPSNSTYFHLLSSADIYKYIATDFHWLPPIPRASTQTSICLRLLPSASTNILCLPHRLPSTFPVTSTSIQITSDRLPLASTESWVLFGKWRHMEVVCCFYRSWTYFHGSWLTSKSAGSRNWSYFHGSWPTSKSTGSRFTSMQVGRSFYGSRWK